MLRPLAIFLFGVFSGHGHAAMTVNPAPAWGRGLDPDQGAYLILTDIHFDPFAEPDLAQALAAAPVEDWDSIFARASGRAFARAPQDTNWPLWQSTLRALALPHARYDYVLILGDFLAHHFKDKFIKAFGWNAPAYEDFMRKTMAYEYASVARHLKGVPIYCIMGNNDADCGDYAIQPGGPLLAAMAKVWATVASDPGAARDFPEGGYYETDLPGRAGRLIGLNDVYWARDFDPACASSIPDEGLRELAWLKARLEADARAHRTVTLALHIPPGVNAHGSVCGLKSGAFFRADDQAAFLAVLLRYSSSIRLVFASHTHNDDFKVLDGRDGARVAFHLAPSISPIHGNQPCFQVGLYRRSDGALLDLATYHFLDPVRSDGGDAPAGWEFEYGFRRAYGHGFDTAGIAATVLAIRAGGRARAKYLAYYTGEAPPPAALKPSEGLAYSCAETCFTPAEYEECACR